MNKVLTFKKIRKYSALIGMLLTLVIAACSPAMKPTMILPAEPVVEEDAEGSSITPYPTRPAYEPGELVSYTAQTGDTLPALAKRFNSTVDEIRNFNQFIPDDATTMPPGMPMQIPIYYRPLWGNPYQILPDSAFIDGPDVSGFDSGGLITSHTGWLPSFHAWAFNGTRSAAEIIDYVAVQYSISPKIFLTLLEYQGGALSKPELEAKDERNILGLDSDYWTGVYLQLSYASNLLNDGYYRWREGDLLEFELADGTLVRPDPWQNAATVAIQYFFSKAASAEGFHTAISESGFIQTYQVLFGDPWEIGPHIPGSLVQPELQLPYTNDVGWAFTGGPHTGWGSTAPWAALDFAPPSGVTGCFESALYTTAVADGVIVRDGEGMLLLDLDSDGDEHTGWVIFYLHIAEDGRVPVGTRVKTGDPLGHPSCEGGRSTGTHIHIARKFNGEWITADGVVPFDLAGWRPIRGDKPYEGWLIKGDIKVLANSNPDNRSTIPTE